MVNSKYFIGIDLGKTFGYSVWKDETLLNSGSVQMKQANKP